MPPPVGISKPTDFNPTCHLKIAEDRIDENEIDLAKQEYMMKSETVEAYFIERPDKEWLTVEPSCKKLQDVFTDCLLDGKQCLR